MANRSKFTEETREKILQALRIGASRLTAAHIAHVDESQIRRWMHRGEAAEEGTSYNQFYRDVLEAEAAPRVRALGLVYRELPDNPTLAWKYLERREPGFTPPQPNAAPQSGPIVIALAFPDGRPMGPVIEGEVIEGEVVDAEEVPAGTRGSLPAPPAAG